MFQRNASISKWHVACEPQASLYIVIRCADNSNNQILLQITLVKPDIISGNAPSRLGTVSTLTTLAARTKNITLDSLFIKVCVLAILSMTILGDNPKDSKL